MWLDLFPAAGQSERCSPRCGRIDRRPRDRAHGEAGGKEAAAERVRIPPWCAEREGAGSPGDTGNGAPRAALPQQEPAAFPPRPLPTEIPAQTRSRRPCRGAVTAGHARHSRACPGPVAAPQGSPRPPAVRAGLLGAAPPSAPAH